LGGTANCRPICLSKNKRKIFRGDNYVDGKHSGGSEYSRSEANSKTEFPPARESDESIVFPLRLRFSCGSNSNMYLHVR
jgi:hypothetical protein